MSVTDQIKAELLSCVDRTSGTVSVGSDTLYRLLSALAREQDRSPDKGFAYLLYSTSRGCIDRAEAIYRHFLELRIRSFMPGLTHLGYSCGLYVPTPGEALDYVNLFLDDLKKEVPADPFAAYMLYADYNWLNSAERESLELRVSGLVNDRLLSACSCTVVLWSSEPQSPAFLLPALAKARQNGKPLIGLQIGEGEMPPDLAKAAEGMESYRVSEADYSSAEYRAFIRRVESCTGICAADCEA